MPDNPMPSKKTLSGDVSMKSRLLNEVLSKANATRISRKLQNILMILYSSAYLKALHSFSVFKYALLIKVEAFQFASVICRKCEFMNKSGDGLLA
ncbi:hypothetical protein DICVIV_10593 [Dictyocaulus viviparus]|uniref:Uncharacterized protein n=1 Tax=Dictyocaulus viviparus TaxID=29172 RepID=A0A0D8XI29_DICVI|nr:hypothetical protein DICVIV_10593 [Dictyocaulus viviparus]